MRPPLCGLVKHLVRIAVYEVPERGGKRYGIGPIRPYFIWVILLQVG